MDRLQDQIYLSPPHIGEWEERYVAEAFRTNWIAPLGPNVDAFEREFAHAVGATYAVALSSGTAALHLALQLAGVSRDDEVLVSSLTFAASVNPICYLGAKPIFIDSERRSWNLDPQLLEDALRERARSGRSPKALVLVHLYGQTADLDPILSLCEQFGVTVIEDAAEALGATYRGKAAGTLGRAGVFSFNGNKIITTSGGGMLVSEDSSFVEQARKLATQARDPAPHYLHSEVGYNYRLSNVLAGIGRGQLKVLEDRVAARRRNYEFYNDELGSLPGIEFMPDAGWGRHTRWLTVMTVDPRAFGADREEIRQALTTRNVEARPVWKPMHQQPVFRQYPCYGGAVSDALFERGLCLPSGSSLTSEQLQYVVDFVKALHCGDRGE